MKVLQLVLKWGSGGVERYVEDLARAAQAQGIDCAVASVATAVSSDSVEGFGPLVEGGVKGALLNGRAVGEFVSDGAYDIVHIHGNNGLAFRFAHLTAKAGAKAVVHSHNSAFGSGARGAKSAFTGMERRLYLKDCVGLLACSRAAGDFLFADRPYRVAPNGVDIARFAFDPAKRADARNELGISLDAPVIGFAASFVDAKNPLFALEVFKSLAEHRPDVCFLVCGDGELLDTFKAGAGSLIEAGRCVCAGRVAGIERYYCAMDTLLAPSKYEGLPINLIEAQTSGLSVVMSDSITNEAVVVPGLCARLALGSGVEAWATAIECALGEGRIRSTVYVKDIVAAGFSQPECYRMVFDAYREVIA